MSIAKQNHCGPVLFKTTSMIALNHLAIYYCNYFLFATNLNPSNVIYYIVIIL